MQDSVSTFFKALLFLLLRSARSERNGRASLFSFHPLSSDVELGVDFEVPFIQVPLKQYKDKFGNSPAMVNINTASLVTSGLLVGGSLIVGHIIRSLNLFQGLPTERDNEDEGEEENKMLRKEFKEVGRRESRLAGTVDYLYDSKSLFDHFKLVYKNGTGERVETTLPRLLTHIAGTFSNNEVDIRACIRKSICLMLQNSSKNVHQGHATGMEKIIDGVSSLPWFLDALMPYEELRTAIEAGKSETDISCMLAYPSCRWSDPETRLEELIRTYMKFV